MNTIRWICIAAAAQASLVLTTTYAVTAELELAWEFDTRQHLPMAAIADQGQRPYLYVALKSGGLSVLDISNATPRDLSTIQPDVNIPRQNPGSVQHPNSRGLAIRGDLLFVANDAGGLRVLDVKRRTQPVEIGRYINAAMARKQQAYNNIVLDGDRAYIAVDYAGLEVVDISNPRMVRQIGWWNPWNAHTLQNLWLNSPGHANQLSLDSKRMLVYLSAGDSELQVVDVSKPQSPRLVSHFGMPKNKLGAWGLATSKDYIFLTYIKAIVPFQGTWSGVKALRRR